MKNNNRGFLVTGMLYSLLLLFLVLMIGMLAIMNARQNKLNYISRNIITKLNDKYTFDVARQWEFDYTGNYQTFTVPTDGYYNIELWGAGGTVNTSTSPNTAGRGAYTKGIIYLTKGENIYVYVGGSEINKVENNYWVSEGGYNGGGPGESSGGGATDVRLTSGNWNDFNSLKSRIMVAAGGGGGTYINVSAGLQRGDGGAFYGIDAKFSDYSGHGATQISGGKPGSVFSGVIDPAETENMSGKFGIGGYGINAAGYYGYSSSGGGGGYYGGGHGNHPGNSWPGGGGGSSFISGLYGCDAISESSIEGNIIHTGQSKHYSGKVFYNGMMIAGDTSMPTHAGSSTMIGNEGNGYAKISLLSTTPVAYTATNVVKNGSFENGTTNWLDMINSKIQNSEEYKYYGNSSVMASPIDPTYTENYFLQSDNSGNKAKTSILKDNKYYCQVEYLSKDSTVQLILHADNWKGTEGIYYSNGQASAAWNKLSLYIDKKTSENSQMYIRLDNDNVGKNAISYFDGYTCINLTETFGAGNEPSKEWCDQNISYFDGTITIYK